MCDVATEMDVKKGRVIAGTCTLIKGNRKTKELTITLQLEEV